MGFQTRKATLQRNRFNGAALHSAEMVREMQDAEVRNHASMGPHFTVRKWPD